MKGIKELRLKLGLSQAGFARLLGTGRSLVTMAEQHKRMLTSQACLRFAALEKACVSRMMEIPVKATSKPTRYSQCLIKRYSTIQQKLDSIKNKLSWHIEIYGKNQKLLNVLKQLDEDDQFDPDVINSLSREATKALSCCSPATIQMLQNQVNVLEKECADIRRYCRKLRIDIPK